jgi:hypothetical protein
MKLQLAIGIILLCSVAFMIGFQTGQAVTIKAMIDVGEDVLDIQLSQKAKDILAANPYMPKIIIENWDNGLLQSENPFINHPQAKYWYTTCLWKGGSNSTCYQSTLSKYGKGALL